MDSYVRDVMGKTAVAAADIVCSTLSLALLIDGKSFDELVAFGRATIEEQLKNVVIAGLPNDLATTEQYAAACKRMLHNVADYINAKLPR